MSDPIQDSPSSTIGRILHLLLACVIAVAVVGYFVGIRQGATIADPPAPPAMTPVDDSEALPARGYVEMAGRPFGANLEWKSTLASLERPRHDPLAPVERDEREEARQAVLEARASLRAFDGAPPVVPHPIDQRSSASCLACHGEGIVAGDVVAPKMSHPYMPNCTQCHVEQHAPELGPAGPVANEFVGLRSWTGGTRAWPGAPPTVPHPTFMREDCLSCHGSTGPAPIRTTHPWQQNCLQCHAPAAVLDQAVVDHDPSFLRPPEVQTP